MITVVIVKHISHDYKKYKNTLMNSKQNMAALYTPKKLSSFDVQKFPEFTRQMLPTFNPELNTESMLPKENKNPGGIFR